MRTNTLALVLAAGLAAAQQSNIPACALTCLAQAIPQSGCSLTDTNCQCTTGQMAISKVATPCICKNCSPAEQLQAIEATNGVCEADFKSMGKTYTNTAITLNACEIATGTATSPIISGEQTSAAMSTPSSMMSSSAMTTSASSSASPTGGAGGMSSGMSSMSSGASMSSASMSGGASMSSAAPMSSSMSGGGAGGASTNSPNAAPAVTAAAELLFGGMAAAAGYFAL